MGSIMGSQKIMGSDYGSNISDKKLITNRLHCAHVTFCANVTESLRNTSSLPLFQQY
jgi:hypothetical protein